MMRKNIFLIIEMGTSQSTNKQVRTCRTAVARSRCVGDRLARRTIVLESA